MKNILAVDDNATNLTMVREALKDKYKVTAVTSGEQALKYMEKKTPDLILLDMCMPGMDGMQTMAELKKLPGQTWKVFFLTALAESDMVKDAGSCGAAGCIAKPFVPEDMRRKVYEAIGE